MVDEERLDEGYIVNVFSELETDGDEDIWTQVLKLFEEIWRVPEQEVPDEFVVTVVVFMVSEKVTEIDVLSETDVSPFEGVVDETFGKVIIVGS